MWNFQYEKGSFEVEFRVDAYNHFVCKQYPAHSHWTLNDDETVHVNFGQYGKTLIEFIVFILLRVCFSGEYLLRLDSGTTTLVGHKKDQPENWRRVSFIRALAVQEATAVGGHDHSHSHSHEGGCSGGDCHKEHCDDGKCSHNH